MAIDFLQTYQGLFPYWSYPGRTGPFRDYPDYPIRLMESRHVTKYPQLTLSHHAGHLAYPSLTSSSIIGHEVVSTIAFDSTYSLST